MLLAICSRTIRQQGLNCPPAVTFTSSHMRPPIPSFLLWTEGSDVLMDFDLDTIPAGSVTGSSIGPKFKIKTQAASSFVHDFTFAHWCDASDMPLRDHFPLVNDTFDHWTPDFISQRLDGSKVVVEFTTNRSDQEQSLISAFNTKVGKYEVALHNRSTTSSILFGVVVVSETTVVTNLNLNQQEVDELCFRFLVARAVHLEMTTKMIIPEYDDEDEDKRSREVKAAFHSVQPDWNVTEANFAPFSRRMFSNFAQMEPDKEYLAHIILDSLKQAQADLDGNHYLNESLTEQARLDRNREESLNMVKDFERDFNNAAQRSAWSHKSTVPFPGVIPKVSGDTTSLSRLVELPVITGGSDATIRAWRSAYGSVSNGTVERCDEDVERERRAALCSLTVEELEESKALRMKYHRCKIDNGMMDKLDLAMQGVEAKEFKNHPSIIKKRSKSKKTFPLTADTRDIDLFLHHDDLMFNNEHSQTPPAAMIEAVKAGADAQSLHGLDKSANPWYASALWFLGLPIGLWLFMCTCIGVELSISLKQHCGRQKFIIKKLRFFDIFLLIKPTNSGSHVFYSIAFPESAILGKLHRSQCFKGLQFEDGWFWTEFSSFKMSKLTNVVKCLSTGFNLFWFWRDYYEVPFWAGNEKDFQTGKQRANKMFKFCLLMLLEDKARTEEIATLSRYVMMEGFVSPPCIPKPQKMIEKLPNLARTKFQVWLISRMLQTIIRVSDYPFKITAGHKSANWTGMFNWVTGEPIESTQKLISLFYLGYLKNKEESPERNASIGMYKKILEYEDKHPGRYTYLGLGDPPSDDTRFHEYSISLLKHLCIHAEHDLRRNWGESFKAMISRDIVDAIASLDLERLATLKASSNFNEEWYQKRGDGKTYHRSKVLEKVSKYVKKSSSHVHHIMEECLRKVESQGCMHVCLFKKPQHGGLREIYVLGFEERVVQLVIETIARQICKRFKSETLTNPKQKLAIPETHGLRAVKTCGIHHETVATSDDAAKWNQCHHVTKFALMLCHFTDPLFHGFIIRGCSMFMKKRIMIDQSLIDIIDSHTTLETSDAYLQKIHRGYHGSLDDQPRWISRGGAFVQTETGMMQGILHYTSSLLHTLLQEWLRTFSQRFIRTRVSVDQRPDVLVDVLQSSDDSGMMISFPSTDKGATGKYRYLSALIFKYKKVIGKYLGIYSSVKSTNNTLHLLEFNSEFFFHINHNRPLLRWITACDTISEQESLASRQEEMYNNLTSVLEGGGSFSLVSFCQFGQLLLHYTLLGMTVSPLFLEYIKLVSEIKDPSLGYFLMDHPFGSGLSGFKYNVWVAVQNSILGSRYRSLLEAIQNSDSAAPKKTLDTTTSGTFVQSTIIRFGDRKKWQRLVDRLNLPEDWLDVIDKNPEIVYRRPRDGFEVSLRIAEKVHSPGVSNSLSKGNCIIRVISSSVYILSRSILSDGLAWLYDEEEEVKRPLLYKVMNQPELDLHSRLTPAQLSTLFPMMAEFEKLQTHLRSYMKIEGEFISKKKVITQTRVNILETERFLRARPEDLIADKWFGFTRTRMTPRTFKEEWENLTSVFPWLTGNPSETLELSPFQHHVQLRNFFSRLDLKGRDIRIIGAPIKKSSGVSNVSTAIRDNFFPRFVLTHIPDEAAMERIEAAGILKHALFLTVTGPYTDQSKLDMCRDFITSSEPITLKPNHGKTRTNVLSLFQDYFSKRGPDIIFNRIQMANCGVIGGFTSPQKPKEVDGKIVYTGDGVWRGIVDGFQIQLVITYMPKQKSNELKSITVNSDRCISALSSFCQSWCKEMGVFNTEDFSKTQRFSKASFFMHKFKISGSKQTLGAPIFIVSEKIFRPICWDPSKLEFRVRGNTLNLTYKEVNPGAGQRMFNILSYTVKDTDVSDENAFKLMSLSPRHKFHGREPSTSWICMRALPISTIDKLLERILNRERISGSIDNERLAECFKNVMESTLRRKGVFLSEFSRATQKMLDGLSRDMLDFFAEAGLNDDLLLEEEPWLSGLDTFMLDDEAYLEEYNLGPFGVFSVEQEMNTKYYHHLLLDSLVEDVIQKLSLDGLRKLFQEEEAPLEYKKEVIRLLNILQRDASQIKWKSRDLLSENMGLDVDDDMFG
ncbi:RNA polymerase [Uukuniemi virus]|uniref:RNA-directed RNA polymerase L n=1 Tax=Uukuniemi virus (strain S23) TaxID=487099 RepID=L_UUKS|nr:RNA polymerase [Uukuniemi virus]P33453.1 RecName: Full=RNA-directed RNA polymerase L; Short=Protein L; AltName: Full=Large structural protein; AltName: Full=Replicase; AltName: Full=Transcriptase; Includes: RecName: Full=cap-snatching endonuclease [Uukuniemi virus S23]BAA01590.1 RNA polymerase [Uukuniemi virus]